jgi:hypothetical protein
MLDRRFATAIPGNVRRDQRIRSLQRRNECHGLSLMSAIAVNSGTRATYGGAPASHTPLQPSTVSPVGT